MALAPTPVNVPFTIKRAGGRVKGKFKNHPPHKSEEVDFDNVNPSGLIVNFNMEDDGGTGLLFPDQAARAIWVHTVASKHDPCPPNGASWTGFAPIQVLNGGKTLQVRNPNPAIQLFKFSLNFTAAPSDPNSTLESWDPIGSNRNGGSQRQALSAATVVAVVVGVAAVAAAAALLWPEG